jgi:hypothetical protein
VAKVVGLVGSALLVLLVIYIQVNLYNPVHVMPSAAPDAVQVSVSQARLNMHASTDGPVLTTRVITDPRVVADLLARINALPSEGFPPAHCGLPGIDAVSFGFRFLRGGALVETAIQPGDGCGVWWLSAGRVREPYARTDPKGQMQVMLAEVQPLGCPQAWVSACEGH